MEKAVQSLINSHQDNVIFQYFSDGEFKELIAATEELVIEKDEIIFEAGQEPVGIYILVEGKVAIIKMKEGKYARTLAELEGHTVLGEMALLNKRKRTSTAKAVERTVLLLLKRETLNKLLENNSLMGFKLSHNLGAALSTKVDKMNAALMQMKTQFQEFNKFKHSLFSDWDF
ncbi:MAG: cyclic nucleotide-binding domain-containing protein [Candidatus Cloacimonetes bacterium]|nr:cyclic nucleotide-binding domain-containing protein [Candidatus Cloacimonadota bacterium]